MNALILINCPNDENTNSCPKKRNLKLKYYAEFQFNTNAEMAA